MYEATIMVCVLIAAYMLLYAISEALTLYDEYTEYTTAKRRAKYRKKAYQEKDIDHKRSELWREYAKNTAK